MIKTTYLFLVTLLGILFALGGCEGGDDDDDVADDDVSDDDTGDDDVGDDDNGDDDTGPTTVDWVTITSGSFDMGSDAEVNEQPIHTVTVSEFEIFKTEVTIAQYQDCVWDSVCTEPSTHLNDCNWGETGDQYPVNCVDWAQAATFCSWVGGRLPSESEWEYAARNGGQDTTYPWGNEDATCDYAVMNDTNVDDEMNGCGTGRSWEVCSKLAGNTDQGLCDMAGNVSEWVEDWYHETYDGAPQDGSSWDVPPGANHRALRGGYWGSGAATVRASRRSYDEATYHEPWFGFRCARDLP